MIVDRCLLQAPKSRLDITGMEDAARTVLPATGDCGEARLVVADGSSGSAGSGWWADRLARELCAAPGRAFRDAPAFDDVTTTAALRWPGRARALLTDVPPSSETAWIAHDRLAKGPSATVLGVRLLFRPEHDGGPDLPGGGTWQAVSVGDSCMFQVRADRVVESVAVRTKVPRVVRAGGDGRNPEPELRAGRWHPGDVFYLMTDALARWCLRHTDEGGRPWAALDAQCAAPDGFPGWVHDQRGRNGLEDDDITLLRAGCGPC